MERILKNFDKEEEKIVKVDKAYKLDKKWLKNVPHELLYSMGSMGSLGVLAVFIAVLAIWKPWKKRKTRIVVKERTNVVYKKSDHGIQIEKPVYRVPSKESLPSIS